MYIISNALRSVARSIGRNILIGIIVFVIAVSGCIGLSIRRAADRASETALEGMTVTGQVSMDIRSMMDDSLEEGGGFDRENFSGRFEDMQSVQLEDLQTYAQADCVSDFYYTATVGVNGTESFEAVTTTFEAPEGADASEGGGMPGGFGGMPGGFGGMMGSSAEFSIIGYSSEAAMTDFADGTASITDGEVFAQGTSDYHCLVSSELATFNSLAVGDTVAVSNPDNEEETYTLTVVGIYETDAVGDFGFGGGRGSFGATDPSNQILMSAAAVQAMADASTATAEDTALSASTSGTYVFADVAAYELFEDQARALGMPEEYTVSSSDLTEYERQLVPLETLSTFAKIFLIVVLIIGAAILIVLNLFNIRERKYEIGVLTAIGMKKSKVAAQFLCEVLVVTVLAVALGGAVGAVASVPVTDRLLEQQIASQQSSDDMREQAFGRGGMGGMPSGEMPSGDISGMFGGFDPSSMGESFAQMRESTTEYMIDVQATVDWVVLAQLLGLGLLLSVASGLVSVIFIMRYDPLKILANRD